MGTEANPVALEITIEQPTTATGLTTSITVDGVHVRARVRLNRPTFPVATRWNITIRDVHQLPAVDAMVVGDDGQEDGGREGQPDR